jgi:hypothetical protein
MLFDPGSWVIERVQLGAAASVEPSRDPESVEKPQVDVVHRVRSIGSPGQALERFVYLAVSRPIVLAGRPRVKRGARLTWN